MPAPRRKPIRPKASEVTHAWRARRRRGPDAGTPGDPDRQLPARQAPADVLRAHGPGRLCGRGQCQRASASPATRPSSASTTATRPTRAGLKSVALGDVLANIPSGSSSTPSAACCRTTRSGAKCCASSRSTRARASARCPVPRVREAAARASRGATVMRDRAPTPPAGGGPRLRRPATPPSAAARRSVARVLLQPGNGNIIVNGLPLEQRFPRGQPPGRDHPAAAPDQSTRARSTCWPKSSAAAVSGQAGAIVHATARALLKADDSNEQTLREAGLLTRDAREKERKKYGLKAARKAPQYTKRC